MSVSNDPEDLLYITEVLHKAFVEVKGKGTEAAASTAAVMEVGAALIPVIPFTPLFEADRPFICMIVASTRPVTLTACGKPAAAVVPQPLENPPGIPTDSQPRR